MAKNISVRQAREHNLKNVTVKIPLCRLVVIVGKSGSGKSSLVYDVIYRASQGEEVEAQVTGLPKTHVIAQKVIALPKMSLGETNRYLLSQTIKKAKKGDLLIIDEPCAGLAHQERLEILKLLRGLVERGISVIVVEHNKDIIAGADHVIEIGPESGSRGGKVVFQGTIAKYRTAKTPTSKYVFSRLAERVDYQRAPSDRAQLMKRRELTIKGITKNSIKNYTLTIPLASLVCITGPSGSGKSTLLSVVYGALFKGKSAWKYRTGYKGIVGKTNVRRSYLVDQRPLSGTPTSTPATYLGIWDVIRDVYAGLPASKKMKLKKADFSFNSKNWQAKKDSLSKADYQGVNIYDLFEMTIEEAIKLFAEYPLVVRKLGFLQEVGLGYLPLGQRSGTLSGGEAQRVKLAKILSKKLGDRCIYILDTPSRGLHLSDLPVLVKVFQKIIDKNNTILIADNRDELIKNCDAVIELS
ncbi:MAG: ATP-binding cassette domain-containing protein [Patescibacteria group bacterium]